MPRLDGASCGGSQASLISARGTRGSPSLFQPAWLALACEPQTRGPVQVPSFIGHPHTHMLLLLLLVLLLKNWVPSSWVRSRLRQSLTSY